MDYIMFTNRIMQELSYKPNINFLLSGHDLLIRNKIITDVLSKERDNTLVIIDDIGECGGIDYNTLINYGYQIKNGISGEYCLYNPFQISSLKDISRIRQLLDIMDYDEKCKGKVISYLNFIRHIELLENGMQNFDLTLNKLEEYCTVISVEEKIQNLVNKEVIDETQQLMLLAKYSECASAGSYLEDMFFMLMPYINCHNFLSINLKQAIVFPIHTLGEDDILKILIIKLTQFWIEENNKKDITLLIFDKGYGNRKSILNLINSITSEINMHFFSEDIFTMGDEHTISNIITRFNAKIYSRHSVMHSAEAIEKICGEIEVIRHQKTITYDNRFKTNSPWDILFKNNKTESYTQTTYREKRYYKEMIMNFSPGNGIIEFLGETSLFKL